MNTRGFTLLEIMVVVTIMTLVMGTIFALSLSFANAAEVQEIKISTTDEARRAFTGVTPLLRQAARQTISWDNLPGDRITFRIADDIDGNGFAVDEFGDLELTGVMTIQRDVNDINNDGVGISQLILIDDTGNVRVLANNLQQESAPAEIDASAGVPEGVGLWIEPQGAGLAVTVRAEGRTRRGQVYTTTIREFILPRNTI